MKKIIYALSLLLLTGQGISYSNTQTPAANVSVDTSSFSKNLNSSDNTVQKALNTVDQLTSGGTPASPANSFQYNNNGVFAGGNMYQDSNENIGIGSANPNAQFNVAQSSAQFSAGTNVIHLSAYNGGYGANLTLDGYGRLINDESISSNYGGFYGALAQVGTATVGTAYNGQSTPNGLLVQGNVGIGSSTPQFNLDMGTGSTNYIGLQGQPLNYWPAAGYHGPAHQRGIVLAAFANTGGTMGFAGSTYQVPTAQDFQYWASKGQTLIDLPFNWNYLQPVKDGPLDPIYLGYMDDTVALAKQYGCKLILTARYAMRYIVYNNGGITEPFTESWPTTLAWPYVVNYSQDGSVTLGYSAESYFGTAANPVSPATGYIVSYTMNFLDKEQPYNEGNFVVRPFRSAQNSTSYYEFDADYVNSTWDLSKTVSGVKTDLTSGSYSWALNTNYNISIDIGQGTSGKINITVGGTPLYTTNTISTDSALAHGFTTFQSNNMDTKLSNLVLNVAGDTSSGGFSSPTGGEHVIGDGYLTPADLASMWSEIATHYANENTVYAYDIMSEPHDMPVAQSPSTYLTTASSTLAYQASINAIRAVDMSHWIAEEFDNYAGAEYFTSLFGTNPTQWWVDPAYKTFLSFHYYFDSDHSGTYTIPYTSTNYTNIPTDVEPLFNWAQSVGVPVYMGEYGIPNGTSSDDLNWQKCMDYFLSIADAYENNIGTYWAAQNDYSSITSVQPTNNYTTDLPQVAIMEKHVGFGYQKIPQYSNTAGAVGVLSPNNSGGIYINGNLGISSLTPGNKVDVQGNSFFNGNIGIQTQPTTVDSLTINGGARILSTNTLSLGNDNGANIKATQNTTPDIQVNTKYSTDSSTGGTVTYSGQNTIRTFSPGGSYTFTPSFTGNVTVRVVAGGGGANSINGAGAGGVIPAQLYAVAAGTPITVTVGAGGAAGNAGGNTVFGSLTAIGGGSTTIGGSGPGNNSASSPTAGTAGQGNAGGVNPGQNGFAPGGGGGCGGVGGNGNIYIAAGTGGPACSDTLTGSTSYFAAGGGSAGLYGAPAGSGGANGGGVPSNSGNGGNGTTPGSGGGGSASDTPGTGADGIVVLTYGPIPANETARFTTAGNTIVDGNLNIRGLTTFSTNGINWTGINNINSSNINWNNINGLNPVNTGGINWISISNYGTGKYLSATTAGGVNWNTVSGSGTVTSVGLSSPNGTIQINNTPITSSGTITSDVNWSAINSLSNINTGGLNWSSINSIAKINSSGVNWNNINNITPINYGAINWSTIPGYASGQVLTATTFPGANWQTPSGGSSQWTNVTSGINYSGGNVGVGVSSPGYPLDVAGQEHVSSFLYLDSAISMQNNQSIGWGGNPYSNSVGVSGSGNNNASDNVVISAYNTGRLDVQGNGGTDIGAYANYPYQTPPVNGMAISGNVGIGTYLPAQMLDVIGTVRAYQIIATGMTNNNILCNANGVLGHCTGSASCLTTCTCTCVAN